MKLLIDYLSLYTPLTEGMHRLNVFIDTCLHVDTSLLSYFSTIKCSADLSMKSVSDQCNPTFTSASCFIFPFVYLHFSFFLGVGRCIQCRNSHFVLSATLIQCGLDQWERSVFEHVIGQSLSSRSEHSHLLKSFIL